MIIIVIRAIHWLSSYAEAPGFIAGGFGVICTFNK
ncbi:hypothetical protein ES703_72749 [subsurface metagenome]